MERSEILNEIQKIFIDILDDDMIVITENTTANDIEEWDSLTHIQIVVGVEKKFRIRFTSKEIQSWNNIGEMMNSIGNRL